MRQVILAAFFATGLAAAARADTLVVPSEAYPTVQSAVAAAGDGDTILVQAGTHAANVDVIGRTGLRILGQGNPVLTQEGGGNGIDLTDCTDVEIAGLTIRGVNNGIWIYDSTGVRIRSVAIEDVEYESIGIRGSADVLVSRCAVRNGGGLGIDEDGTDGLVVDRCVFEDAGQISVSLSPEAEAGSGSNGARVTRCTFTGGSDGIVAGGEDLVLDRNAFTDMTGLAIDLQTGPEGVRGTVSRNTIAAIGTDTAVRIEGTGNRCLRNRITGGGIVENGSSNVIEKNTVSTADFGIAINGPGAVVSRNRLSDFDGIGIDLTGSGHRIEKNVIERSGASGVYASVTDSVFLSNRVTDAQYGFLVVYGGNSLARNRVAGTTLLDLWDQQGEGANAYERNVFRTTLFGNPP